VLKNFNIELVFFIFSSISILFGFDKRYKNHCAVKKIFPVDKAKKINRTINHTIKKFNRDQPNHDQISLPRQPAQGRIIKQLSQKCKTLFVKFKKFFCNNTAFLFFKTRKDAKRTRKCAKFLFHIFLFRDFSRSSFRAFSRLKIPAQVF
jgi:hypothetical protein